jgi:hypothetical protein
MNNKYPVHQFANGDVYFWLEQESSIMLKAVTSYGDPVELGAEQVREIAEALLLVAKQLEDLDSQ